MDRKIYSVSEINGHIKSLLDSDMTLDGVFIRGELSNYKIYPSGHHYFTMKDAEGALRCVMFKGSAVKLRYKPENGMKVVAFGRISVFPRDGAYQLYVSELTPDGVGDLHVAFEQLKAKLSQEGLFSRDHKKPIPRFPERVGVITSGAGAAVRDIIRVLGKRYPLAKVIILPVRVQGTEAPPEIVGAIKYANKYNVADVLIVGRGGGSIEDLWAFNDERVARAIYASEIPVISAVGHEPDVTISDFVADVRAATPSNGAELCVPDMEELLQLISGYEKRMCRNFELKLKAMRGYLESVSSRRVMQSPMNYIDDKRLVLDRMQERLIASVNAEIAEEKHRFIEYASKLDALSPLKVLRRGYSIVKSKDGNIIKSGKDVKSGDVLTVRFEKDDIDCKVL